MKSADFDRPLAFLVFNRPHTTRRVFEEIRRARPPVLLVVADGPRGAVPGETEKCEEVRSIIETVDWPCRLMKNYSDANLGCKARVSSGLDWVFQQVDEAVILEDDCLPHPTFFWFCQELLVKYADNPDVSMISGFNLLDLNGMKTSYYYSRLASIWGWATWASSWKHYDVKMAGWPDYVKTRDLRYFGRERANFLRDMGACYEGKVETWDAQWAFACLKRGSYSILPARNLVTNIGFGRGATHTPTAHDKLADLPSFPMRFPLVAPDVMRHSRSLDIRYLEKLNRRPPFSKRLYTWVRKRVFR